jgi:DNA-directed RNA polymerase subunit M/transcription elongation factor TFIIS
MIHPFVVKSIKVQNQREMKFCSDCKNWLIPKKVDCIKLILWNEKGRSSKQVLINAIYCENCDHWIVSKSSYNEVKKQNPSLKISVIGQGKVTYKKYNPVPINNRLFNKSGIFLKGNPD